MWSDWAKAQAERVLDSIDVDHLRFLSTEHLLAEGLVPLQRAVTACVREHLAEETAAAMTKERLLMTAVTGEEAVATLAPIRAQLERGITAAESAAAWASASLEVAPYILGYTRDASRSSLS